MNRKLLVFLALAFVGIPLLIAVSLWRSAAERDREADVLSLPLTPEAAGGEAVRLELRPAPGQAQISARHTGKPCLVYQLQVLGVSEVTDSDGDTSERSEMVYEEREGVDPLLLTDGRNSYSLALLHWEEFHGGELLKLTSDPPYLRPSQIPDLQGDFLRYDVHEYRIAEGDPLFVAGRVDAGDRGLELSPDLELGSLVLFPGTQQQCIEAFRSQARWQRVGAYFLLGFAALVGFLLRRASR